ncbi:DinB family protein [Flindersiella endophytica]
MTSQPAMGALIGGIGLFERAVGYTLGCLQLVRPSLLDRPTPCAGWDVRALLAHMNDSLLALHEAIAHGSVGLDPYDDFGDPAADPVATLKNRACALLGEWSAAGERTSPPEPVAIADLVLTTELVAGTGAIEVAVHGWDLARACGADRPIPLGLAADLLPLVPFFVTEEDRPIRFAARVPVPRDAELGDQLLAFLGRDPSRS